MLVSLAPRIVTNAIWVGAVHEPGHLGRIPNCSKVPDPPPPPSCPPRQRGGGGGWHPGTRRVAAPMPPALPLGALPHPRYGKQMRVHDSALPSKGRRYTTNAKKEGIFSDTSQAPFTGANRTADARCDVHYTYGPTNIIRLVLGSRKRRQAPGKTS